MMKKKIIFVTAHPDDVSFGFGGTALLLKEHYQLHIFCATKGERGKPHLTFQEVAAVREAEKRRAAALLDAQVEFLGQIDGEVFGNREICLDLSEKIKTLNPVAIFTLWPIDTHKDHAAVGGFAAKAVALSGVHCEFYYGEVALGVQTLQFTPNIYMDISEVWEQKKNLLAQFPSQNSAGDLTAMNQQQCGFRGLECGVRYAEGFRMPTPITNHFRSVLLDCCRENEQ